MPVLSTVIERGVISFAMQMMLSVSKLSETGKVKWWFETCSWT